MLTREYALNAAIDQGCAQKHMHCKVSKTSNQVPTKRSPIVKNICIILSMCNGCFISVCKLGEAADLM